jgi:hypothetical protein
MKDDDWSYDDQRAYEVALCDQVHAAEEHIAEMKQRKPGSRNIGSGSVNEDEARTILIWHTDKYAVAVQESTEMLRAGTRDPSNRRGGSDRI